MMNKNDKFWNVVEIVLEVGPDVVQAVIDLYRSGEMTPEKLQALKENSPEPEAILAEHGIFLD